MLTLFTIPKPFRNHVGLIQRNAIRSWAKLQPSCEILLIGNEEGTSGMAREVGAQQIEETACNEYGTPLVNDAFEKAERAAKFNFLCYVNADIILMNDFAAAVGDVVRQQHRFVMVGQRSDIDITDTLDFSPTWEAGLREQVRERGQLHPHTGIDYFAFPKGLWWSIPPFAVGRMMWDNWLIYRARALGVAVIDATGSVLAVHQNHDYDHFASRANHLFEGPETMRNRELARHIRHVFTLLDATHKLAGGKVYPIWGWRSIWRRMRTAPSLHPWLESLVKPIRLMREKQRS